jgi:hypothetical protein
MLKKLVAKNTNPVFILGVSRSAVNLYSFTRQTNVSISGKRRCRQ